jgi:CHAT domain-containing protein
MGYRCGHERLAQRPALQVPAAQPMGAGVECPYAHPYYWAAFVLIGDPE